MQHLRVPSKPHILRTAAYKVRSKKSSPTRNVPSERQTTMAISKPDPMTHSMPTTTIRNFVRRLVRNPIHSQSFPSPRFPSTLAAAQRRHSPLFNRMHETCASTTELPTYSLRYVPQFLSSTRASNSCDHYNRSACTPVPRHAWNTQNLSVIEKWLAVFLRRFAQNQFKRSSMPDGPKVGSVALSPRGDWRMPSDWAGALE